MTKLKVSYFGHIMRTQGSLEKTVIEGSRKSVRLNVGWIDSMEEAVGMGFAVAEQG